MAGADFTHEGLVVKGPVFPVGEKYYELLRLHVEWFAELFWICPDLFHLRDGKSMKEAGRKKLRFVSFLGCSSAIVLFAKPYDKPRKLGEDEDSQSGIGWCLGLVCWGR